MAFSWSSQSGVRGLAVDGPVLSDEGVGVQPVARVPLLSGWRGPPPHHHLLEHGEGKLEHSEDY